MSKDTDVVLGCLEIGQVFWVNNSSMTSEFEKAIAIQKAQARVIECLEMERKSESLHEDLLQVSRELTDEALTALDALLSGERV